MEIQFVGGRNKLHRKVILPKRVSVGCLVVSHDKRENNGAYVEEAVRGSMYRLVVVRGGRIEVFVWRGSYLPDYYQRDTQPLKGHSPGSHGPLQGLNHRLIGSDL
jgi:hypothetical protein